MITWIAIGLVGGLGAVTRFLVTGAIDARIARDWPFGTLVVNVSGALVLGALAGAGIGSDAYLVVGTGFLGAYTTFSTWMVDSYRLARGAAVANIVVSLALGLAAAAIGHAVT